ncbi:hypothetical protein [Neglectibacter timonensis]|uniref:hypothetical protein n=1 Tax=Neglectibacter timonensis TaxID=1776382 RepID=UPI00210E1182|nr:hypothetical protein [Neglectibacter timonensis]MCQ4844231.1 hypothetical protein [Neglectibacter timonensis]MEE0730466.1 hypothetical protein [Oscillospiraceae bacterium]
MESYNQKGVVISKVTQKRGKTVYATYSGDGAIIVDNRNIKTLGKVGIYNGNQSMQIDNRPT